MKFCGLDAKNHLLINELAHSTFVLIKINTKKCYFRCLLTFSFFGITGLLEDDASSRTSSCNLEYNTCTKLNQRVNIR